MGGGRRETKQGYKNAPFCRREPGGSSHQAVVKAATQKQLSTAYLTVQACLALNTVMKF